jgi:hypothetical protein
MRLPPYVHLILSIEPGYLTASRMADCTVAWHCLPLTEGMREAGERQSRYSVMHHAGTKLSKLSLNAIYELQNVSLVLPLLQTSICIHML